MVKRNWWSSCLGGKYVSFRLTVGKTVNKQIPQKCWTNPRQHLCFSTMQMLIVYSSIYCFILKCLFEILMTLTAAHLTCWMSGYCFENLSADRKYSLYYTHGEIRQWLYMSSHKALQLMSAGLQWLSSEDSQQACLALHCISFHPPHHSSGPPVSFSQFLSFCFLTSFQWKPSFLSSWSRFYCSLSCRQ